MKWRESLQQTGYIPRSLFLRRSNPFARHSLIVSRQGKVPRKAQHKTVCVSLSLATHQRDSPATITSVYTVRKGGENGDLRNNIRRGNAYTSSDRSVFIHGESATTPFLFRQFRCPLCTWFMPVNSAVYIRSGGRAARYQIQGHSG